MGRQNKNAPAPVVENTTVVEEKAAPVEETPKVSKAPKITVRASFKTRNLEGDRIVHKYAGEGVTPLEALDDVKGSDEDLVDEYGKPFPRGANTLVDVTVKRGSYELSRALAPHVQQDILVNKNVESFVKRFGL